MDVLAIEVVYALQEGAECVAMSMLPGATVRDAIAASGILERHRGIDLHGVACGIYGERVRLDRLLVDGDRVEIYRPLRIDPKEARRRRARLRR